MSCLRKENINPGSWESWTYKDYRIIASRSASKRQGKWKVIISKNGQLIHIERDFETKQEAKDYIRNIHIVIKNCKIFQ